MKIGFLCFKLASSSSIIIALLNGTLKLRFDTSQRVRTAINFPRDQVRCFPSKFLEAIFFWIHIHQWLQVRQNDIKTAFQKQQWRHSSEENEIISSGKRFCHFPEKRWEHQPITRCYFTSRSLMEWSAMHYPDEHLVFNISPMWWSTIFDEWKWQMDDKLVWHNHVDICRWKTSWFGQLTMAIRWHWRCLWRIIWSCRTACSFGSCFGWTDSPVNWFSMEMQSADRAFMLKEPYDLMRFRSRNEFYQRPWWEDFKVDNYTIKYCQSHEHHEAFKNGKQIHSYENQFSFQTRMQF